MVAQLSEECHAHHQKKAPENVFTEKKEANLIAESLAYASTLIYSHDSC